MIIGSRIKSFIGRLISRCSHYEGILINGGVVDHILLVAKSAAILPPGAVDNAATVISGVDDSFIALGEQTGCIRNFNRKKLAFKTGRSNLEIIIRNSIGITCNVCSVR